MDKRILVTGCGGAASANFIKSLRMSDERYYIVGTDSNKYRLELSHTDVSYQMPLASDPSYVEKLNEIIHMENIQMVHAQPDPEVLFLSNNREKIDAIINLPAKETVQLCQDKYALINRLRQNNIPVAEARSYGKRWYRATKGAGGKASLIITTESEIKMWRDYWRKREPGIKFMLSEFLPGPEYAWQSLWWNGKLIVSQARQRLEYLFGYLTPSGQTSSPTVAKTVHNSTVNQTCTDAILAVDSKATGIFCVDLKENDKGVPCVTEINAGRFFTTSNFITEAGCNMPHYHAKLSMGDKMPPLQQYNPVEKDLYWVRGMDVKAKLMRFDDEKRI